MFSLAMSLSKPSLNPSRRSRNRKYCKIFLSIFFNWFLSAKDQRCQYMEAIIQTSFENF